MFRRKRKEVEAGGGCNLRPADEVTNLGNLKIMLARIKVICSSFNVQLIALCVTVLLVTFTPMALMIGSARYVS